MASLISPENKLFFVFMPSLLARFRDAERASGVPLTLDGAREIRQNAVGVIVSEEIANKLVQRRGFQDLDSQTFWTDWQQIRVAS